MVKYIYKNKKGRYEIRKRIGGVLLYWGSFTTLEEAKLYRAYYMGKHWRVNPHYRETKYICKVKDYFIVRKRDEDRRLTIFGVFKDLETAKEERDICIKCGWDFDQIVEFEDGIEV